MKVSGFCLFVPGCLQQVGWVEGELGEAALCDTQSREEWQLCPHQLLVLKLVWKWRV